MNSDQIYTITVFSKKNLSQILLRRLKADLEKVSFETLCRQYSLDCSLIDQTLRNLDVSVSRFGVSSYFIVKYLPPGGRPLIVQRWQASEEDGSRILPAALDSIPDKAYSEKIARCSAIYTIALYASQLKDMGLLLGYEVARWIGFHGDGMVRDLHGDWHSLNQHQAFIPVSTKD